MKLSKQLLRMTSLCLTSGTPMTLAIAPLPPASASTGEEMAKQKAYPGKITDEELEKEQGGSGLRYSFDIKRGAVTHEVGVDAQNGKVLENAKEGTHPD
jgi:hypothetical protein